MNMRPFKIALAMVFEQNRKYRYHVVDVFTEYALEGNSLAVFPESSGLDSTTMQRIAKELNLSETAFIGPATRKECAIAVRIFTPVRELQFAGHPTIGTAFVAIQEGFVPETQTQFIVDEKIGPVPIQVDAGERPLIWLTTPPIHFGPTRDPFLCTEALRLESGDLLDVPPQFVTAGNLMLFVAVRTREAVDRASLDSTIASKLKNEKDPMGFFIFTPTNEGAYSRMFAPDFGVREDPATGSATGPLAAYMLKYKLTPPSSSERFLSEQGTKMGRRSFLHIRVRGDQGADGIDVGGYVTPVIEGTLSL